jgi:cation:H+ antiporter
MILDIGILIFGLLILIKGADWLVKGGSSLAKKYHLSDLAIGLTIVAFGTSAPELVVNGYSAYNNQSDLVLGNVIGSNNFNLFIILGLAGLITPITVKSSTVWKEIPISFLAVILLFVLANDFLSASNASLSRLDGMLLLTGFCLFLYYVYKQLKTDPTESEEVGKKMSWLKIWLLIIIGIVGLVVGGQLAVTKSVEIASELGVSAKVIGITILAAGTSLPELATSVVAAIKKNNDIAVGNIIGSNIFNFLFIISVSSFVRPINFNLKFNIDLYILSAGTLFLFIAMFTGVKKKLDRWEAGVLFIIYTFYLIYLVHFET